MPLLLGIFLSFLRFASCIKLWSTPASLPSAIPAPCRAMMAADIACAPQIVRPNEIVGDVPFDHTFLGGYCNSTCSKSLDTYLTNINTHCGSTEYDFGGDLKKSASAFVAPVKWARDVACTTGTSASDYCYPKVVNRTVGYCEDCMLKYFAGLLGSDKRGAKIDEEGFISILSSCNMSPIRYPHSTVTIPVQTPPLVTGSPNITCWGGEKYTIKQGDTCKSVAAAKGMALDRFLYLNGIDFNCNSFVAGREVCVRDACKLHTVTNGDSCKDVAEKNKFTKLELVQWNPILETGCDNITALEGHSICITPPGTDKFDFVPTATWNNSWTWPAGSWVPLPTQGTPFNYTKTRWDVPTTTISWNLNVDPTLAAYFQYCPVTDQHWEDRFSYEMLSPVCEALINRYCDPVTNGAPLPSTTFPSSCFPPYPTPID